MANYPTTAVAYGQTSADVKALQNFLISQGKSIPAGATGYFGDQTKAALTQWQNENGITGAGIGTNWGPQSISKASGTGTGTGASNSYVNPNQAQIDAINAQVIEAQKQADAMQKWGLTNTDDLMVGSNGDYIPRISPTNPSSDTVAPVLKPQLVPGTPEYQAALDKLSTAYYDVMLAALNADTEAQQVAAQGSWDQLRKYTSDTLGISLSENSTKAWDQIQGLRDQAGATSGGQNITGSGIQQESIDDYLRSVRSSDKANRLTSKNTQDTYQAKYYQGFASPAQVKALVESNPELARSYGLIPSAETLSAIDPATLKAKYPNITDAEINNYRLAVVDENGNRRSTLWQKKETGGNTMADQPEIGTTEYDISGNPVAVAVNPTDTGRQDIEAAKKRFITENVPLNNPAAVSGSSLLTTGAGSTIGTGPNNTTPTPNVTPIPKITVPQGLTSGAGVTGATTSTQNTPTSNVPLKPTDQAPQELVDKVNLLKKQVSDYIATMSGTR